MTAACVIVLVGLVLLCCRLAATNRALDIDTSPDPSKPGSVLLHAVIIVGASGVLAAMVVEFGKRLTPLRWAFNRAEIIAWFSPAIITSRSSALRSARRQRWTGDESPDPGDGAESPFGAESPDPGDGAGVAAFRAIRLRTNADALTAQLSAVLRTQLHEYTDAVAASDRVAEEAAAAAQTIEDMDELERFQRHRRAETWRAQTRASAAFAVIAGQQLWALTDLTPRSKSDDTSWANTDAGQVKAQQMAALDRWLDGFHAAVSERWVRLTQALAAVVAAVFAATAASEFLGSDPWVVVGFFGLGAVVGGPIAWLTSDLGRLVEGRRA